MLCCVIINAGLVRSGQRIFIPIAAVRGRATSSVKKSLSLFRLLLLTHFWMPPSVFCVFIDKLRGMNIVICTTANTDEEAKELLTLMGAPFEK